MIPERVAVEWSRVLARLRAHPFNVRARVVLSVGRAHEFPEPRDFAYTVGRSPIRVVVSPRLALQPKARVRGVLRHEVGHVAQLALRVKHASKRDEELHADEVAHLLYGAPVRYDEAGVQTTGRGTRRPEWVDL